MSRSLAACLLAAAFFQALVHTAAPWSLFSCSLPNAGFCLSHTPPPLQDPPAGTPQPPSSAATTSDPYTVLYPPLRSTLICLSKLYRAVDGATFGGLAQEAVAACAASIQSASRAVARRSGPLDAQLFMIRHLLLLREQIAPFDVDFSATHVDLDFSHMREQLRAIMAGSASVFSLGANNAVVKMLGSGGPRVLTMQVWCPLLS